MESLLSWLRETEAQMNGGMEKMEEAEKDDHCDQLTQQLNLCKASCPWMLWHLRRLFSLRHP